MHLAPITPRGEKYDELRVDATKGLLFIIDSDWKGNNRFAESISINSYIMARSLRITGYGALYHITSMRYCAEKSSKAGVAQNNSSQMCIING